MSEEEKSYIINQADLYLSGKSLREIAEIIGKSHITVRNNLTNKLKYADAIKYEKVMEKILDNKEKTIENETVRLRVLEAYRLLVEEGKIVRIKKGLVDRYDAKRGRHDHFFCNKCGKIIDIYEEIVIPNNAYKIGRVLEYDINFTGICKDCIKEEKNNGIKRK